MTKYGYIFDTIRSVNIAYNQLHSQKTHTIILKLNIHFKKLHVSAPRRYLQGVSFEYKHQYIARGSTMPSIRIFKDNCYRYKIHKMISITLQLY
jgi:hypothetical protein